MQKADEVPDHAICCPGNLFPQCSMYASAQKTNYCLKKVWKLHTSKSVMFTQLLCFNVFLSLTVYYFELPHAATTASGNRRKINQTSWDAGKYKYCIPKQFKFKLKNWNFTEFLLNTINLEAVAKASPPFKKKRRKFINTNRIHKTR